MAKRRGRTEDPELPFAFVDEVRSSRRSCCGWQPPRTHDAGEVPVWLVRPHVTAGYRMNLSLAQCLLSLFYLHNETLNIWTHLFGCGLALRLAAHHWRQAADGSNLLLLGLEHEAVVVLGFLLVGALAFLASASYHLGNCGSERCCAALLQLDVTGIALLIAASFVPGVYYGFSCFPRLQSTYLTFVSVLLVVGLGVSNWPGAAGSWMTKVRNATFVSFVAIGLAMAIHWCTLVQPEARTALSGKLFLMLGLYLLGFVFYASRWPERWRPGRFNVFLHSHQLWHACVVGAFYVWFLDCRACHDLLAQRGCDAFVGPAGLDAAPRLRTRSPW